MKLFRFRYSPFARKVEMVLDLLGRSFEVIDVPYGDRTELAALTGGYIYVPVLVEDDGTVITESRAICEHLLPPGSPLVPTPLDGPIWAYSDFADEPLEEVLFKIASPAIRDAWPTAWERALYVLVKERKYGAGCVDDWRRNQNKLITRAQRMLAPTLRTLAHQAYLFGAAPTLADAALYGSCAMLEEADATLLPMIASPLIPYMRRIEAHARDKRGSAKKAGV